MLVLTRKQNEQVVIQCGDTEIRCMVVEVIGNKVKLGWEADPSVQIDREEIARQRKQVNHANVAH